MIISDQIKAEDRANVLRALLLKHSHPNDEKDVFFPRNPSASSVGSVMASHHHNHNHTTDTCLPPVGEEKIELHDTKSQGSEVGLYYSTVYTGLSVLLRPKKVSF
ncbi:anion exchange protein 3-like isoform X2 [Polyodon spathula]|uniref:anion exchange protein 3-like isoform X2 n=1 Tax=Polyodon spathula TaxID=7913 RepID=UPI001B7DC6D6|nr:anion exchange protein 3-like isoform X2 [Polyodon spathula]